MTNAEARCNKSLRPRKPEGSLGQTAQDVHLDSHTAPELWHMVWAGCHLLRLQKIKFLRCRCLNINYTQIKDTKECCLLGQNTTCTVKYFSIVNCKQKQVHTQEKERKKIAPPRRGIEPRSPAWQAGILTTILPRSSGVVVCLFVYNSVQIITDRVISFYS